MSHTLPSLPTARSLQRPARSAWRTVVAASATVAVLAIGSRAIADGPRVDLSLHNPTTCTVNVEVTDDERAGYLDLGTVAAGATAAVPATLDQGATWHFRFGYGGETTSEADVGRAELEARGWRFDLPAQVAERRNRSGCDLQPLDRTS